MLNQSITTKVKKGIVLLPLASLLMIGALASQANKKPAKPAPPVKIDCSTVTDADVVKQILDKIEADAKFKDQLKQINVSRKTKSLPWTDGSKASPPKTLLASTRNPPNA